MKLSSQDTKEALTAAMAMSLEKCLENLLKIFFIMMNSEIQILIDLRRKSFEIIFPRGELKLNIMSAGDTLREQLPHSYKGLVKF